ncbi:hypothetical protein [Hymenobacter sp. 102]|uniref:hypothetical protein n=1 Tax=Hymenobacter sp. 102 TaxID=3403152 RepID=UPI003CF26DE3
MRTKHAADAPAAHCMALGLAFDPQSARAIALAVVGKRFTHGHLLSEFGGGCRRRPQA